jgi:hypothetical protein
MRQGYPFGVIVAEIGHTAQIKGIFGGGWQ